MDAERLVSSEREHRDFMDKMLEGELPDEEPCQFLVVMDFIQWFWGRNDETS